MKTLKGRFDRWKKRSRWQKAGDIFFWLLLLMLLIPGPRKVIVTGVNKVMLHVRRPSIAKERMHVPLDASDYEWSYHNAKGTPFSFSDHKGDVIFLNFWATWCPPCIAELPEIQGIYDKYGDRVTFLLLTSQEPAEVNAFMEKRDYDLPIFYYKGGMPEVFHSRSIPTTYIISRQGSVVSRKTGAADWDSKTTRKMFDQLLNQEVLR